MLYLVASLYAVLGPLAQQQAGLEDPVWSKVKQNVLTIESSGQPFGLAVLLDNKGHFLAHKTAIAGSPVTGKLNGVETVILTLVTVDEQTQLALLQAENWIAGSHAGVRVATSTQSGSPLVAATLNGPVKGEFVRDSMVGQMRPSLRYTPLSEIRIESNMGKVGGALVFDQSGSLVGLLGATLVAEQKQKDSLGFKLESQSEFAPKVVSKQSQFGPQGMTVAYSLGSSVLRRVVDGFLSTGHKVEHPSVGLFFKDSKEPGVLVELVKEGSPAALAGIRAGDLVTEVNGSPVRSPVDLAVMLFERKIGEELTVTYRRDGESKTVKMKVTGQSSVD